MAWRTIPTVAASSGSRGRRNAIPSMGVSHGYAFPALWPLSSSRWQSRHVRRRHRHSSAQSSQPPTASAYFESRRSRYAGRTLPFVSILVLPSRSRTDRSTNARTGPPSSLSAFQRSSTCAIDSCNECTSWFSSPATEGNEYTLRITSDTAAGAQAPRGFQGCGYRFVTTQMSCVALIRRYHHCPFSSRTIFLTSSRSYN